MNSLASVWKFLPLSHLWPPSHPVLRDQHWGLSLEQNSLQNQRPPGKCNSGLQTTWLLLGRMHGLEKPVSSPHKAKRQTSSQESRSVSITALRLTNAVKDWICGKSCKVAHVSIGPSWAYALPAGLLAQNSHCAAASHVPDAKRLNPASSSCRGHHKPAAHQYQDTGEVDWGLWSHRSTTCSFHLQPLS